MMPMRLKVPRNRHRGAQSGAKGTRKALWGPELYFRNAMGGVGVEFEQFVVVDPAEGRMKRILNYEAQVITPSGLSRGSNSGPLSHQQRPTDSASELGSQTPSSYPYPYRFFLRVPII